MEHVQKSAKMVAFKPKLFHITVAKAFICMVL